MNPFCYSLNLNIPLFKDNTNSHSFPKVRHKRLTIDLINPEIHRLFDSLNLRIILVEVFYSKPNLFSGIHVDSTGGDINKINWIYGGKDCQMHWYSINDSNSVKDEDKTIIGTRYQSFNLDEVTLEYSNVLSSPSLVHGGVPHNVNNGTEDRWCVSLVYDFKDSKKRPTMKESLALFKNFIR